MQQTQSPSNLDLPGLGEKESQSKLDQEATHRLLWMALTSPGQGPHQDARQDPHREARQEPHQDALQDQHQEVRQVGTSRGKNDPAYPRKDRH